jgi:hypothetical protein
MCTKRVAYIINFNSVFLSENVHADELQGTVYPLRTASVVWSEFLATDAEVPDSIPDHTRFSEKVWA